MTDLIARLEAATADDAGLMQEAWSAIYGPEPASGYTPRSDPPFCPKWEAYIKARARFHNLLRAEAYESAALTLVPEGCSFDLDKDHHRDGGLWGCIIGPDDEWHGIGHAKAATPALAIVIAAMKARECV